jgi:CHAT domain-containing protein
MMFAFSARLSPAMSTAVSSGVLVACLFCRSVAAIECDPMMAEQRADLERSLIVRGGERVQQSLRLAAQMSVIVAAAERGGDLMLEVSGVQFIGRADSPIRRSGIQRVAFTTSAAGDYNITLIDKDSATTRAEAALRVVSTPVVTVDDACLSLQRQIALADQAYADGLIASKQTGAAKFPDAMRPPDAAARFRAAVDGYLAVARQLAGRAPSLMLAQSQHSAAAALYQDISEWAQAKEWSDAAAASYAAVGDAYSNARARAMSAAALMEVAMSLPAAPTLAAADRPSSKALAQARRQLAVLAEFHRDRHEIFDQALVTNNIGLAYYLEDRNDEAIETYRRVLPLYEQLHEQPKQAQVLSNIATAEYELGRTAESSHHYDQLLRLIAVDTSPKIYADALNNKAVAEMDLGHFDIALNLFGRALDVARTLHDSWRESYGLQGVGSVFDLTGDPEQALAYYRQALVIRTAAFDSRGRVTTLRNIANILRDRGEVASALAMHKEAMSLEASASARARISIQIVKDLEVRAQWPEARRLLEQILREPSYDAVGHALALLERGRLRGVMGESSAALGDLRQAAAVFRKNELSADEFSAWLAIARVQRQGGAIRAAVGSIDRALALSEEIRLQSANPELRASLLQPLRPAFDLKISMLAARYFATAAHTTDADRNALAAAALATAEQARARALADYQSLDARLSGVPSQLLQQRRDVLQDLATKRNQLEMRMDRGGVMDSLAMSLRTEIATSRRKLNEIDARIGSSGTSTRREAAGGSSVMLATSVMPKNTVVIEYWLGAERALAWVLTGAGTSLIDLGSSAEIADAARVFHDSLRGISTVAETERLASSERLYTLAVRPLAHLIVGSKQLMFVPDGALHYTSFAALGERVGARMRFLVEDHDIGVTPSVAMLLHAEPADARHKAGKQVLLVADPVYQSTDTRLTTGPAFVADAASSTGAQSLQLRGVAHLGALERLPATAAEAQAIASLWPENQVDRLEGFSATREKFLASPLDVYRYIHVAAHGIVDTEIPQLSSLVLSTRDRQGREIEGRVLAADFITAKIAADAVVLSACDTALGKNITGEGLIGLRYVILARGAKSVVASLWPVPDQISAQLMPLFYAELINEDHSVVAALSGAMRKVIARSTSDPAMWGAFAASVRAISTVRQTGGSRT